jgi:protein-disulfide isomerase
MLRIGRWLLLLPWAVVFAQPAPSSDELNGLREDVKALRRDIEEIKVLLRQSQGLNAAPTGQDVVLRVGGDRVMGNPRARVTIVEFADFECSYCGRFARETFPQIEREYIRTGKVRYAFRHYPMDALHPNASKAAHAAGCAAEQGKFWEMHARLFGHQQVLDEKALPGHAKAVRLDLGRFQSCLAAGAQGFQVQKDMAEASRARVRGTPTMFLGRTQPGSEEVKVVDVVMGAQPYLAFKMAIERLLDVKK